MRRDSAGLSVGVIGLGLGRSHAAACADSLAVSRLVICDADPDKLAKTRSQLPRVAAAYDSIEKMLAKEKLDAVSIVTPDHLHRPHAEECLAAGCHALVTKPIATSLDDARAMVHAAEAAGRKLMVAHERRFRPRFAEIKDMLSAGALGDVIHLQIATVQDKRRQFDERPWYRSAESGRSAIVGTGIHQVDLARFLVGRPVESVLAVSNHLGDLEFPADTTTSALLRFAGGATAQVTVTLEAHWPKEGRLPDPFWLIGTQGMVFGDRAAFDGRDDWQALAEDTIQAGTARCVMAFLAAVAEDAPPAVDGRDAFASLAVCVAADESARTGRAVAPEPADFV